MIGFNYIMACINCKIFFSFIFVILSYSLQKKYVEFIGRYLHINITIKTRQY